MISCRLEKDASTLGLWHFTDGSGTQVKDYSGNVQHGTTANTPTWVTNQPPFNGLQLNGTSQYLSLPNNLWNTAHVGTIEAIINLPAKLAIGVSGIFFGLAGTTNTEALFSASLLGETASDTRFRCGSNCLTGGAAVEYYKGSTNIPLNVPVYLVVTSDGSVIKMYVNGAIETLTLEQAKNTGAWFADNSEATTTYSIGVSKRSGGNIGYFGGVVSELRVSNIARSAAEIKQNWLRMPQILTA